MISFNKRSIIGIFDNVDIAADAVDSLKDSGYAENEYASSADKLLEGFVWFCRP